MSTAAQIEVDTPEAQHARLLEETKQSLERAGIKSPDQQIDLEAEKKLAEQTGGQPASAQHIYNTTSPAEVAANTIVNEGPVALKEWANPEKVDLSKPKGFQKFFGQIMVYFKAWFHGNKAASIGEDESKDARGLLAERILKEGEHLGVNYDVKERKN